MPPTLSKKAILFGIWRSGFYQILLIGLRLWSLNPYIQNPDLIFPGNSLRIPGRSESILSGAPLVQTETSGLVSRTMGALDQGISLKSTTVESSQYAGDSLILSALRSRNPLSGGFYASVPFFWTGRDASGNIYPGDAVVDKPSDRESYQQFDRISITPQKGASYSKGDTVDIYKSIRFVRFQKSIANLIKRTGRGKNR